MVKLSCKTLKNLIQDEIKGENEYKHLGLNNIAKDEHKHRKILEKMLKEKCK